MTEYLTEQEQIEIFKNWIKQYSLVFILAVLLSVAAISGWRYWQDRQLKILHGASESYDAMLSLRAQNDAKQFSIAENIIKLYPSTSYAQIAAFILARGAVNQADYKRAEKYLNWVLENSKIASIKEISRIRLARIYLTLGKPEQSLKILDSVDDKTFIGLINEVRGDAYLLQKNGALARKSYEKALQQIPNALVVRPLLQMKYDNLAT